MKLNKPYPPTALRVEWQEMRRCMCQRSTARTVTGTTTCHECQRHSRELVGVGEEWGHSQQPTRLLPPATAR